MSPRRLALTAVAALLSATAALAVGILLFGSLGETQGRILLTTLLFAVEGILALAPLALLDARRARGLAAASLALSTATVALSIAFVWGAALDATGGKLLATVTSFAVAAIQSAIVVGRARAADATTVRRLGRLSHGLGWTVATATSVSAWAAIQSSGWLRALGALLVADVLSVGLQPLLARRAVPAASRRFRVSLVGPEGERTLEVAAPDPVEAVTRATTGADRTALADIRAERIA